MRRNRGVNDEDAPTAILLYSGGLDSILAYELLRRLGVKVIPLQFRSIFYPPEQSEDGPTEEEKVRPDISADMVELLRDPQFGFGSNVNPCIDCKVLMYRRAADLMERRGADFIATGEVVGQRPMSQRRDTFRRMEQAADVEDIVLRPLCARHLPPTKPEREGLIDRDELLNMAGRTRKPQMSLAEQWDIHDYPAPAGGCRLTDPNYAQRIETLMDMHRLSVANALIVQSGRFFPLDENAFAVVGRDHEDNLDIVDNAPPDATLYDLDDLPGPLAALVGPRTEENVAEVRRLVIRYSRFDDVEPERVVVKQPEDMRRKWRGEQ